ncbi:hypothetical protein UlMin_019829 [Ulmus minor]
MAMEVSVARLSRGVRFEAANSNGASLPQPRNRNPKPHLSFTKVSWVVRTESNVRREVKRKPDPPCAVCLGSGRIDCHHCCGRGRTNYTHLEMLPEGKWPKWCRICGGSGLEYCPRCLGTGEYRYIMGFKFMNRDVNDTLDHRNEVQGNHKRSSVADFYE